MANTSRELRRFGRSERDARCARRREVYAGRTLLALLALAGCDPVEPPADGGERDAPGSTSFVEVRLGADDEELPDEWRLEEAWVSLESIRVDNDRGVDLEPVWSSPGRVRLDEERASMRLEAIPATYGGLALRSERDAAFELTLRRGDARVHGVSRRAFDELMIRCASGAAALRPGELIELELTLTMDAIAQRVGELVGEPSEDVELDEDAVEELEVIFDSSWRLECGPS